MDDRLVLAPVAVSEISQSETNEVRTILARRGLKLGMIANFQAEKLDVKCVRLNYAKTVVSTNILNKNPGDAPGQAGV